MQPKGNVAGIPARPEQGWHRITNLLGTRARCFLLQSGYLEKKDTHPLTVLSQHGFAAERRAAPSGPKARPPLSSKPSKAVARRVPHTGNRGVRRKARRQ